MNKRILLLTVPFTILLGGCKKQTAIEECPQVAEAPREFLNYWFFPEGSYWVYRQRGSAPAVYDTVRAGAPQIRVFKPGQATYGLPTCVTLYEANFSHSNRTFFRGYSSLQNFMGFENMRSLNNSLAWGVQQSNEAGNVYSTGLVLTHPLPPLRGMLSATGPTLLDTTAVTVPAGHFRRSLHFATLLFDSTSGSFLHHYYLARGVGYTRKVYTRLGTWELVAYKINR